MYDKVGSSRIIVRKLGKAFGDQELVHSVETKSYKCNQLVALCLHWLYTGSRLSTDFPDIL